MDQKFIRKGPVDKTPLPKESVGIYLLGRLLTHGARIAQINATTGVSKTFLRVRQEALAVVGGLQKLGVVPGDIVMLACSHPMDSYSVVLGALCAGATVAPINNELDRGDLKNLLSLMKPKVAFCEKNCKTLPPRKGGLTVIMFDSPELANLLRAPPADLSKKTNPLAFILFSSGTTGPAKGVMLTQSNIHSELLSFRTRGGLLPSDVVMLMTAIFWITGLGMLLVSLDAGITTVMMGAFTPSSFLENIEKYKVTVTDLSSNQLLQVTHLENDRQYNLSSLRFLTFGGAPVSPVICEKAERKLGVSVYNWYSMTETLAIMLPARQNINDHRCSGVLTANAEAKVIDLETKRALGPKQTGEICLRGPTLMQGYYHNPEATAAIIDSEGWLHTGDVGYYEEDGRFFIVDRIKSVIKYRGVHVNPADIEGALMSHPAVKEAAVIGVDNDLDQMHAMGFVVLRHGSTVKPQELVTHVAGVLPPSKQLHGGVKIVRAIPKTSTGKVRIKELKQLLGLM